MFELRHLRHFVAVAAELNFSRASEKLNIAQPALSRSIQNLEISLGFKVLKRTNRNVALTPAGISFLEDAEHILELASEATRRANRASKGEVGELKIGYTDFAINGVLPSIIQDYCTQWPLVRISPIHGFSNIQFDALRERKLDIGFLNGPVLDPNLDFIEVQEDRFVVVLPKTHALAHRTSLKITELADEPFVLGDRNFWIPFHSTVVTLCRKNGFSPNIVQQVFNSEGVFGFVACGMGVTIHLESARNHLNSGVVIVPLEDIDETVKTNAVWLRDNNNPASMHFVHCLERFRENA
jgi:DNA-binding transcriptional LysR family regulator